MKRHSLRAIVFCLQKLDIKTPMLDPMRCIAKVANKMKLNERITRQGMNIMHTTIRKETSAGKNPMGLALAVLYVSYLSNNVNNSVHNKNNESSNNKRHLFHNNRCDIKKYNQVEANYYLLFNN
jgi:transcription initiation factor TFIIIB Brf1 subunit/transcription initiation factor TFIIB